MKLIHPEKITLTTSSGSASGNTSKFIQGILRQILVKPTTSTTQYDITITNADSLIVYSRVSEQGEMGEITTIPIVEGIYTIALANATADEAFTVELIVETL